MTKLIGAGFLGGFPMGSYLTTDENGKEVILCVKLNQGKTVLEDLKFIKLYHAMKKGEKIKIDDNDVKMLRAQGWKGNNHVDFSNPREYAEFLVASEKGRKQMMDALGVGKQ